MTLFIGDVHGKYRQYKRIIRDHINSIQVGDMGVGFFEPITGKPLANPYQAQMRKDGHRFIRGNHDNPHICKRHPQWIKDCTIQEEVMFLGGGDSVDKGIRVKDYTWWEDEQLSPDELATAIDIYKTARPRVMVTHEAPGMLADMMMAITGRKRMFPKSDTCKALQIMLEEHQPDIWIFGHWHTSFDRHINGTRFVCLDELESKEIEVGL